MQDTPTGSSTSISARYLCTLSDCVNWLNDNSKNNISLTSSITSNLISYIGGISVAFEQIAQRPLKIQNYWGVYDGTGDDTMYLHNDPIQSVNSIYTRINFISQWTLVNNPVIAYNEAIVLYNQNGTNFNVGQQNYMINYNVGYDDISLESLRIPVVKEVALALKESKGGENLLGMTNRTIASTVGGVESFDIDKVLRRNRDVLYGFTKILV